MLLFARRFAFSLHMTGDRFVSSSPPTASRYGPGREGRIILRAAKHPFCALFAKLMLAIHKIRRNIRAPAHPS
jgi:hypothetical protein